MRGIDPPQRDARGGGSHGCLLRGAAVRLGARRDVEADPCRRDGKRLVAGMQVWNAGKGARPLPIVRPLQPQQTEARRGRHHLRAAARREGPAPGALRPVRRARLRPHRASLHVPENETVAHFDRTKIILTLQLFLRPLEHRFLLSISRPAVYPSTHFEVLFLFGVLHTSRFFVCLYD